MRERDRDRERVTERETQRDRDRKRETDRHRERERERELTSSTHCACCSLRAISTAVSPAEFTTGDLKEENGLGIYLFITLHERKNGGKEVTCVQSGLRLEQQLEGLGLVMQDAVVKSRVSLCRSLLQAVAVE